MRTEAPERSRGRELALTFGAPAVFFVAILALWQLAVDNEWLSSFVLPPPGDVATSFVDLLLHGDVWGDIFATTYETVAGFVLGAAIGVLLAIATCFSHILKKMLYPFIVALQVTPRIALAPIIIAWLGFGYSPKIVIVILVVFFPVFLNTVAGIESTDSESREMFRSLGASRLRTFRDLELPNSLPVMFAGFKTAMTFALLAAIVAEFISAEKGLGQLVSRFSYQLNMDDAFGVIIMLTLLGLLLYAVMEYLDRIVVFWRHDGRMSARTRRRNKRDSRKWPSVDSELALPAVGSNQPKGTATP